jgi:hypothetical protein
MPRRFNPPRPRRLIRQPRDRSGEDRIKGVADAHNQPVRDGTLEAWFWMIVIGERPPALDRVIDFRPDEPAGCSIALPAAPERGFWVISCRADGCPASAIVHVARGDTAAVRIPCLCHDILFERTRYVVPEVARPLVD